MLKISVITPNLNGGAYLEKTILSVLNQNYPCLEYIIVDGGSTDESLDIIEKYKHQINHLVSEPDTGLYDALQKGFKKSSGEIMMWINSDDLLHPHAFLNVSETFQMFKTVNWITGINTFYNDEDRVIGAHQANKWSKFDYYLKNYEWIQQESTVWRRELWDQAGGYINSDYKLAGDLELWTRFFKHDKIHTCNFLIGGFRYRQGEQLSSKFYAIYKQEAMHILNTEVSDLDNRSRKTLRKIIFYQNLNKYITTLTSLEKSWLNRKINALIAQLKNYPPSIEFDIRTNVWKLR